MNDVIQTLMNHRSFRQYSDLQVEPDKLKIMIESAQAAPSWVHGQQVSIIAIKDPARKQQPPSFWCSAWTSIERN
ncbi:nitroreductase family protein [Paenibacillus sp. NPDC101420]|uniref:nitroreductase family protein n=1 Tax=Paenibacillus sp. NPDC101420 TaxID=3390602 RepID=UPI003D037DDD